MLYFHWGIIYSLLKKVTRDIADNYVNTFALYQIFFWKQIMKV